MDLSIIIVSYNVKYFLEFCLISIEKAIGDLAVEVIVVDNGSSDRSSDMIRKKFPWVTLRANTTNDGFSKASNDGFAEASGEFILFLNPDTIIAEDTLAKCIGFIRSKTEAGALGVNMIDGSGCFLPESKRGLPNAWNAFTKMIGLSRIFPHSKLFAGYYHGDLDPTQTHEVEILSGAFLLVRASLLKEMGGFDTQFFMYGEDIDLSFRLTRSGCRNYYYAGTSIIHFKGESTRRDQKYTRLFYKAMRQFVAKHVTGPGARVFRLLLNTGIHCSAFISSVKAALHVSEKRSIGSNKEFMIMGDETLYDYAIKIMSRYKLRHAGKSDAANKDVVFCIGNSFGFGNAIAYMRISQHPGFRFFAGGTSSIIGSFTKAGKGEVLVPDTQPA